MTKEDPKGSSCPAKSRSQSDLEVEFIGFESAAGGEGLKFFAKRTFFNPMPATQYLASPGLDKRFAQRLTLAEILARN